MASPTQSIKPTPTHSVQDLWTPKTGYTALTVLDQPDLSDLNELLATMKQTLGSLGATFDTLGQQTARVAAIGPALETANQVQQVLTAIFSVT